jgi:hypothetical protein
MSLPPNRLPWTYTIAALPTVSRLCFPELISIKLLIIKCTLIFFFFFSFELLN